MNETYSETQSLSSNQSTNIPLGTKRVCWKGIFVGIFAAIWTHLLLMSLGFGIGGLSLKNLNMDDAGGFSVATGIWLVASTVIALFVGGYLANRTARIGSPRLSAIQGIATAAAFFFILTVSIGMGVSAISSGIGKIASVAGEASSGIASQPIIQNSIEDGISNLELRRDSSAVIQGLATRLIRGDTQSAKNYLISNSNLSEAEADQKIAMLRTNFDRAANQAKETTGNIISAAGWMSFAVLLLGAIAAALGGLLGYRVNTKATVAIRGSSRTTTFRKAS